MIPYPRLSITPPTTYYMECTHSYLPVPPLLSSWHWYFVLTILHGLYHIPFIWTHLGWSSCYCANNTMHQSRWTLRIFFDTIMRLYYIVLFTLYSTHTNTILLFSQQSSSRLDTRVLIKYTKGYISGSALFIRYNNMAATEWKIYLLYSSSLSALPSNVKIWCCAGEYNLPLISYPNFSITSSRCSFMYILIFFSFVISMFTPRKECFLTFVITISP